MEVGALPEKPFNHRSLSALDGHDQRRTFRADLSDGRVCRSSGHTTSGAQQEPGPLMKQPRLPA